MKLNKVMLIAALALGSLLTIGTNANAQAATNAPAAAPAAPAARPARGGRQFTIEQLTTALTLTDAEKPKVQALLDDMTKKLTDLRADTTVAQADRAAKMTAIRKDFSDKMKEILTADQFTKFQALPQPGARRGAPPAAAPAPAGN
jgi:Spy/CpxP family protein refolding chaperone